MTLSRQRTRPATYLGIDKLHDRLLQVVQVHRILSRSPRNHVVLVVIVSTHGSKLLSVRELDVDTVLLHDTLDAAATDTDDALVI